ncbi:MAG: hypothetical protein J6X67_04220 [Treponema sp.]|nr:hypothetical protein [Treponema sp.]
MFAAVTFGLAAVTFGLAAVTFGLAAVTFGLAAVTFGLAAVTFGLDPEVYFPFAKKNGDSRVIFFLEIFLTKYIKGVRLFQ